MAKITRKDTRVFAGDVPAVNVVSQFGSLKAGTPAYSSDPNVIQNLAAWGGGWSGATVNNAAPPMQDMNAFFYVLSRAVRYLEQQGIPEYSATMTYYTGSLASDGAGAVYISLTDDNTGNLLSDTTKWRNHYSRKMTTQSGNYVLDYTDWMVRFTGSSAMTATIPAASSENAGREIVIKSLLTGGALVTVSATGGSLIDGAANQILTLYQTLRVVSNGTSWDIV